MDGLLANSSEGSVSLVAESYKLPRILDEEEKETVRRQTAVSDYKRMKVKNELRKNWDKFYLRNKNNFFKDRWWTQHEFGQLLSSHINLEGNLHFLEVGCGVGNTVFPLTQLYPHWTFQAFDFSDNAIKLLCERCDQNNVFINTAVADLTSENLSLNFPLADIASLIFVLSSIPPEKQQQAIKNLTGLLRPQGIVVVRDYGINDHAMLRYGRECKLDERFYAKQDGTVAYYFQLEEVDRLFQQKGFHKVTSMYLSRKTVNHQKNLSVDRVFIQAAYMKSL
ncbi:unnamed protein product [Thelazia callipaeda]|uniref:tRNA N(3)-methylcytidine methyltransferase n=1 Tax=Thelazia callipaeda TaxID=103827 RepID=A0A0N5D7U4_THECL|nr:unnamed protein product [Thelazia callipaeda]